MLTSNVGIGPQEIEKFLTDYTVYREAFTHQAADDCNTHSFTPPPPNPFDPPPPPA
jgi:hypothetical protein